MRIAICDDNIALVDRLALILQKKYKDEVECIDKYANSDTLLNDLAKGNILVPDILMMDICLKEGEKAGILSAKKIKSQYPDMQLIFITGYLNYVPDIFMTNPDNLLMKPIRENKVIEAIDRAIAEKEKDQDSYIQIKTRGVILTLEMKKIVYIESDKHELMIHFTDRTEQVRMKMDDILTQLTEQYIRIHQSYAVNARYLKRLTTEEAILSDDTRLPVSRGRYRKAKEELGKYLLKIE